MRTDRQTDMATIIVAFRNYAKATKDAISGPNTVKTFHNGNFLAIQLIQTFMQNYKTHFLASTIKSCNFFEQNSLVSAVARSLRFNSKNPKDGY